MVIMNIRRKLLAKVVLISSLVSPMRAAAAEQGIWKIGTFNHSSGEFRDQGINYADPKSDPVFVVGRSRDGDWYRFQPGPANGMTGARLHPYTLKFTLKDTPHGVYHLKIAMLYETPRLSFLKLEVNG